MDQAPKMEEYFDLSMYGSTETGEDPDDENDYYYTRERYWYHPNYLGNVDMITNDNGHIHQYFVYSPFGENMYQYNRNSDFDSRYRFNGKEIDEETGNGYYGARYYNPKISVWLSVDPEASKDPDMTVFHFVYNNPIGFVDPNGLHGYKVDLDGNYELVDDSGGDDFDVLYNEDLTKTAATTFEPGTFTTKVEKGTGRATDGSGAIIDVSYDYHTFEGDDSEKGEVLYNFLKDNTNVEWAKVDATNSGNEERLFYVSTSHSDETAYGGVPLTKKAINTKRFTDVHFQHSHPKHGARLGPSDWSDYPNEGGDLGAVKFLHEVHAPYFGVNLRTSVYDKTTKKEVFYNQNGILKK